MPPHEPDIEYPCPSVNLWQAGRADNGNAEYRNIVCEAADVVVATNVPATKADELVAAHNGVPVVTG